MRRATAPHTLLTQLVWCRVRWFSVRLAVRQRVVFEAADLHVVTERVIQMQTVEPAVAHVLDPHGDQLGLGALAVEVRDRVADVVDHRVGLWPPRSAWI